jgi:hypothetical protein
MILLTGVVSFPSVNIDADIWIGVFGVFSKVKIPEAVLKYGAP